MATFSKKVGTTKANNGYPRDSKDNKYYKEIQVSRLKDIITEDFTLYIDADSLVFKSASVQDESYLIAKHIETGVVTEHKTKTVFKGAARLEGKISQDSYLGRENLKLEARGKELLKISDYELEQGKRLKADGNLNNAVEYMEDYIKAIKFQFEVDNLVFLVGSGKVFRNDLLLPEEYKSNRSGTARPILLREVRQHLLDNHTSEFIDAKDTNYEVDDRISMLSAEGYKHYRKHKTFNKGILGIDKDQYGTFGLIGNWDRSGVVFKQPQFVIVEASDKGIGTIEMVGKDCKCSGLLQVAYQMLCGDSSDHYHPYLRFPKEMQPKESYSDASFFKEFYPLETPQECVQKVIDRMQEFFPFGLEYTAWEGTEVKCDTMEWTSILFSCVYMLRSEKDTMSFTKLCAAFKVDTSAIVGNNKLSAPVLTFIPDKSEKVVDELKVMCDNVLPDMVGFKTLKKGDLVALVEEIVSNTKDVNEKFSDFYEMVQQEKTL